MLNIILTLLAIFLFYYFAQFCAFIIDYNKRRELARDLPGPESLFLIGNVHQIPQDLRDYRQYFLNFVKKYVDQGEEIARLWVGPYLFVYPLTSDAAKVITNSTVELNKGMAYDYISRWLGKGLITIDGKERWHKNRKMITPAFHFAKLDEYVQVMDSHCKHLIDYLEPKANGEIVDLYNLIKMSALDIIMETAMGQELNALENSDLPYVQALDEFSYLTYVSVMNPFIKLPPIWYLGGYESKTKKCLKIMKDMTEQVIRERLELRKDNVEYKKRPDFLDMLLNLGESDGMPIEEIREEVDTFMFAGHDTTTHTISWAIWALATSPKIQQRLYEELINQFPDKCNIQSFKTKDLKYLDAVIKESMRFFTPVPFLQRKLKNDVQIGKYFIPKGSQFCIAPFILHNNHKVFPNHHKFDPETFLNGQEYPSNAYIPFSSGPRNCIGQKFAMYETKIMLIHIILNYQLSADLDIMDNLPKFEIILKPSLGVPVRLTKRD